MSAYLAKAPMERPHPKPEDPSGGGGIRVIEPPARHVLSRCDTGAVSSWLPRDTKVRAMTMPTERTRALLWAGGFLIELARDKRLPVEVRRRAVVIARHFPTKEDVTDLAFLQPIEAGGPLAPPDEVAWKDDCKYGPLLHGSRFGWPE